MIVIDDKLAELRKALENGYYNAKPEELVSAGSLKVTSLDQAFDPLLTIFTRSQLGISIPAIKTDTTRALFMSVVVKDPADIFFVVRRMAGVLNRLSDQGMLVGALARGNSLEILDSTGEPPYFSEDWSKWRAAAKHHTAIFCFPHVRTEDYDRAVAMDPQLFTIEGSCGKYWPLNEENQRT